jgi:hypothetical protein
VDCRSRTDVKVKKLAATILVPAVAEKNIRDVADVRG